MDKKEAFYKDLKEKLENNTKFPSDYLYKFIVPTDKNQEEEVKSVFDHAGAVITTRSSKNGKFVSLSILLKVENADAVITNYHKVEEIEGIISL